MHRGTSSAPIHSTLRPTNQLDGFPATRVDPTQVLTFEKDKCGNAVGTARVETTVGARYSQSIY